MSRTTNEALTQRILASAKRLWHEAGEDGLTIRAVAKAAGTTSPSVYQRFPSKASIIQAIGDEIRVNLGQKIAESRTLEEGFRNYLRLARKYPNEFELFYGPEFATIFSAGKSRPGLEFGMKQLAARHGGSPQQYERTAYAIMCLLQGAASLLQHMPPCQLQKDIEESCLRGCKALADHPITANGNHRRKR